MVSQGPHPGYGPVEVADRNPNWPLMFEQERERIEAVIGPWLEGIEHVGSTAVPGLAAKPVIDIMVGVETLESGPLCVEALTGIGYEYVPEFERELPERRYFRKFGPDGCMTYQIHLVERSNSGWWDLHIAFRDHLRAHPDAAAQYAGLKRHLAESFRYDRASYTDAKTEFVRRIELQAIAESLPLKADSFTTMTFNVRGSQHRDGENEWPRRARLNVECIRRCAPDLIGFQEFQQGNLKTYDSELRGYERLLGPGYENRRPWAYNAIYWDPGKLSLLEDGGLWLSETPEKRSRSWDSSHVRSATWARFRTLQGAEFFHLNTHLDHKSADARVGASRLIIRTLEELTGGELPVVITGDFNCNPGFKTYNLYEAAGHSDVHRIVGNHPENTFHRFLGRDFIPKRPDSEARLDRVLVRGGSLAEWEVRSCTVVRDERPPVYPSDHYPVVADLTLSNNG